MFNVLLSLDGPYVAVEKMQLIAKHYSIHSILKITDGYLFASLFRSKRDDFFRSGYFVQRGMICSFCCLVI